LSVYCNGASEEWAVDNFRVLGAVLPVTWSDYQVIPVSEGVKISWATASEQNSDFFAIERSLDGNFFSEIYRLNAAGNSSTTLQYEYLDAGVPMGTYYYRIRQADGNGDFISSEAIEVTIGYPKEYVLYPNPVSETMNITLAKEFSSVTVFDHAGRLAAVSVRLSDDQATIDVSSLETGMYFARIEQFGGNTIMKRFSISR
jgi:Secretion system C-terminal sorting domain